MVPPLSREIPLFNLQRIGHVNCFPRVYCRPPNKWQTPNCARFLVEFKPRNRGVFESLGPGAVGLRLRQLVGWVSVRIGVSDSIAVTRRVGSCCWHQPHSGRYLRWRVNCVAKRTFGDTICNPLGR
ncbi:hypothetical protein PLANPX_1403 [Lacipirellula parvula]|uniref:Uncharacterized protein n=1 Tax=Lacipirellula parvula TaxID=2650471 RepID=A0A5K7XAL7_9BACT|nr:hypothetical protein PLANPX_1403 [Lacipirellula parvula]